MENINEENIQQLQLGDIIRIYFNTEINETTELYYIQYIDKTVIVGVSLNTNDEIILNIENEEIVSELNINKIDVVFRNEKKGFLKQNNLKVGVWISIYFDRDVPLVVTGKIIDIEEDKMTLETYPEKDVIYLDFEYKGVHKDYNKYQIKEIVITDDKSKLVVNTNIKKIENMIKNRESVYNLGVDQRVNQFEKGQKLDILETNKLPSYIQKNQNKYKQWLE